MSQFSEEGTKMTLKNVLKNIPKDVYPVGRLDYDSEGLLLLTNDKKITHQLLQPSFKHQRTYFVQVEGDITEAAIAHLQKGVPISINGKKHITQPAIVNKIEEPGLPDRNPPIRFRKNIPTSWISITLTEGKNRQVRRMTAAVGFPTLRLVRYSIGQYSIDGMAPGAYHITNSINKEQLMIRAIHNTAKTDSFNPKR